MLVTIDTTDHLTIRLGYALDPFQCGTLEDVHSGKRTFYFANTSSARLLKRFDDHGRLLQSVPLSAALDSIGLTGFSVIMQSPDSILLFSEVSSLGQFFALVDGQGAVRRTGPLSDALVDPSGDRYEVRSAAAGRSRVPGGYLFEAMCTGNTSDTSVHAWDYAYIRSFYGRLGRGARMAMFRWDAAGPSFTFGQSGFYERCCAQGDTTPRNWSDGPAFTSMGDRVYLFSMFSPWVYRLNERMAAVDSFLVRTDLGPCHVQLPVLTEEESQHMQDSSLARAATRNYIVSVNPCPPLNALLVQVMKGAPLERSGRPDWRPEWSWVVYDTSGVRSGERRFAGDAYDGWCVLWNKDRAWVKRASSAKERREGTLYFDRLTLMR